MQQKGSEKAKEAVPHLLLAASSSGAGDGQGVPMSWVTLSTSLALAYSSESCWNFIRENKCRALCDCFAQGSLRDLKDLMRSPLEMILPKFVKERVTARGTVLQTLSLQNTLRATTAKTTACKHQPLPCGRHPHWGSRGSSEPTCPVTSDQKSRLPLASHSAWLRCPQNWWPRPDSGPCNWNGCSLHPSPGAWG